MLRTSAILLVGDGLPVTRPVARRVAFVIGVGLIAATAIGGTISGRRSAGDYARARNAVRSDINRYERVLVTGESRARAISALRTAGAEVESTRGDIVITVLHELQSSSQCRSLVGQLQIGIDADGRVTGWESPPLNAECD